MGKEPEWTFPQRMNDYKDIQMTNTHMKGCSVAQIVREMQTKTIIIAFHTHRDGYNLNF